jgi:hypothetical protein
MPASPGCNVSKLVHAAPHSPIVALAVRHRGLVCSFDDFGNLDAHSTNSHCNQTKKRSHHLEAADPFLTIIESRHPHEWLLV